MRWIDSYVEPVGTINAEEIIKKVEIATRTCYRSEDLISEGTAEKLIRSCIKRGHESVIEHGTITFRIVCDRAIMAEITRHRMASYSIESTRYCAYSKEKFGGELSFIKPWWLDQDGYAIAVQEIDRATQKAEESYLAMLQAGYAPDVARCILPNCLATTIVVTMNMREIRHFLRLRLNYKAHPDIRIIAKSLYKMLQDNGLGIFVEDISCDNNIQ